MEYSAIYGDLEVKNFSWILAITYENRVEVT